MQRTSPNEPRPGICYRDRSGGAMADRVLKRYRLWFKPIMALATSFRAMSRYLIPGQVRGSQSHV
jgi:hypothetical protein